VAIFGILGLALFSFGFGFGGYQWMRHALRGEAAPLGTIMVAVLPLILGFQLILQAVVLDLQQTPRPGRR
jgi:dolichol-phosphate mannosyltransferase